MLSYTQNVMKPESLELEIFSFIQTREHVAKVNYAEAL